MAYKDIKNQLKAGLVIVGLLWIITGVAHSLYGMSEEQAIMIKKVKKEARKHTRYPSTIAAICLVESSAGANRNKIGDDGKSFGIMQIQAETTKWLSSVDGSLAWVKKLSKYDIQKLLLSNDRFSVEIASKYFDHYRKAWGYRKAIMIYNGGVNNWTYYNKVRKALKITRRVK